MSYELISRSTVLCRTFSRQFWAKALELAQSYGWQPGGTCPPSHLDLHQFDAEWDGRYATNDGQTVKAEDALSLAAALERSLDDISSDNLPMDVRRTVPCVRTGNYTIQTKRLFPAPLPHG